MFTALNNIVNDDAMNSVSFQITRSLTLFTKTLFSPCDNKCSITGLQILVVGKENNQINDKASRNGYLRLDAQLKHQDSLHRVIIVTIEVSHALVVLTVTHRYSISRYKGTQVDLFT